MRAPDSKFTPKPSTQTKSANKKRGKKKTAQKKAGAKPGLKKLKTNALHHTVMVFKPGALPQQVDTSGDIEALKRMIDGPLEAFPLGKQYIVLCDEEGRLKGQAPNDDFPFLVGTVVVTRFRGGSPAGLNAADLKLLKNCIFSLSFGTGAFEPLLTATR